MFAVNSFATATVSRRTVKTAVKRSIAAFNLILSAALLRAVYLDSTSYSSPGSLLARLLLYFYAAAFLIQLAGLRPRASHPLAPPLIAAHLLVSAAALRVAARAAAAVELRDECVQLARGVVGVERLGVWGPGASAVGAGDASALCNVQMASSAVCEVLMLAATLAVLGASIALVFVENAEKDRLEDEARAALLEPGKA